MIIGMATVEAGVSQMTDEEVVRRVQAGETALFEILMRRYNQRLFRVVRSIVTDDAEAEDIIQEAYVEAYFHLSQFEGRAKFSTWLTKIAVHEALARIRNRSRMVEIDSDSAPDESDMALRSKSPDPEQEMLTRTLALVLEAAIDALPQIYSSAFIMREVEGMSTAETADCLGISDQAVKVRLHRARSLMRKQIYAQTGAATSAAFQFLGARCDRVVSAVLENILARPR